MPNTPSTKKISVLLVTPVYNEEKVLEKNVEKILRQIKKLDKYHFKVRIIDNGSKDNTRKIGLCLQKRYFGLVYYKRINKKGRGRAIREAWKNSSEEILCYMDIDLSTSLKSLDELIKNLANGYDLVIGSRYIPGSVTKRSAFRYVISKSFNFLIGLLFGTNIRDLQCGFKGITLKSKKILLNETKENFWFFDTELILLSQKRGLSIKEIPLHWTENKSETKVRIFKDFLDLIFFIFLLKIRLSKMSVIKKAKSFLI